MITQLSIFVHPNRPMSSPKIWGGFTSGSVNYTFSGEIRSDYYSNRKDEIKIEERMASTDLSIEVEDGYKQVVYDEECKSHISLENVTCSLRSFLHYCRLIKIGCYKRVVQKEFIESLDDFIRFPLIQKPDAVYEEIRAAVWKFRGPPPKVHRLQHNCCTMGRGSFQQRGDLLTSLIESEVTCKRCISNIQKSRT